MIAAKEALEISTLNKGVQPLNPISVQDLILEADDYISRAAKKGLKEVYLEVYASMERSHLMQSLRDRGFQANPVDSKCIIIEWRIDTLNLFSTLMNNKINQGENLERSVAENPSSE